MSAIFFKFHHSKLRFKKKNKTVGFFSLKK